MNSYKHLKNVLFHNIKTLSQVCSIFCVNPDADFTRNRKLDFETIMKIILCMGASSIKDELLKFNDFSIDTPSASAFVQARSKIKPEAFKALFDGFNKKTFKKKLFHGYRLLAIAGSELPIDNTIFDDETTELRHGTLAKPYSAYHLNASYDLLENVHMMILSFRVKPKKTKMMLSVNLLTDMMDRKPSSLPIEAMNPTMVLNMLYTQDINISFVLKTLNLRLASPSH